MDKEGRERSEEIERLGTLLNHYDNMYRVGTPLISDNKYDKLYQKYISMGGKPINDGIISEVRLSNNKREKMPIYMSGLDKVKSFEEFQKWVKFRLPDNSDAYVVITPKLDGVSCGIDNSKDSFSNNGYIRAYVKGDNNMSFPIWNHFKFIMNNSPGVEYKLDDLNHIGEIIILNSVWALKYAKDNKNIRNFVAGKLNPKGNPTSPLRDMIYMRYDLSYRDNMSKSELIDYMNNNYNPVELPYKKIRVSDIKSHDYLDKLYREWSEVFTMDGLVIELDSPEWILKLGYNNIGNPNYSVAYKSNFEESAKVKIKGIKFNLDKDGRLVPVVSTDKVMLDGALCGEGILIDNIDYMRKAGIYLGKKVKLRRSGKVIPRISTLSSNIWPSYKAMIKSKVLPESCPYCEAELIYNEKSVNVFCNNIRCKEQIIKRVTHFFETIKVYGVSESTIRILCEYINKDYNHIGYIQAILALKEDELLNIKGISSKKANNIYTNISEAIKSVSLEDLMSSTNLFKGLASKKIKLVLDFYSMKYSNRLYSLLNIRNRDITNDVAGYSDISTKAFINGIPPFRELWLSCLRYYVNIENNPKDIPTSDRLNGVKVCFTGIRDKELEKYISDNGGDITKSVSKNTSYLIAKDINGDTSKLEDARSHGIEILTLEEARALFKITT